ncbi:sterol desaturase family protein [Epibacterium sp. Ofav1-8]|uniref:sterol desaturase family protein n=1 Tax=Epibacterium sp. Ofav1-8 TaxID=2917735 RepID=UPI001EF62B55|nr:sterol desaturase family protein [Epibacterium sp. Ofav1-8]MCG7625141.1 sterol desaturase family protein [Epibacterium sp. Ofav1-8]
MTQILDAAQDLLALYVDVFGGDLLRYLLGAGGVFLAINLAMSRQLAGQKIGERKIPAGQMCREILASLRTVAIFATAGTMIAVGARSGVMRVYPDVSDYGLAYFWISTALLIVLHDAWFYWTHRALHFPPLFRRFHRLHHRSNRPTPFTSYSFDFGEAVVNGIYLPLILLVLPAHPLALLIFVTHMMLRNALAHCGYEVFPARRDGRPLFGWMTTVTHHDMHHAYAGKNLGFYFTWWDRWMGTEHPAYLDAFKEVSKPVTAGSVRLGLVLVVLFLGLGAGGALASDLKGRYAAPGLSAIVEFTPCQVSPDRRCGTLVWMWTPDEMPHGEIGEVILPDLEFDGRRWVGRLKSPQNGWVFRGEVTAVSRDQLHLRGCAGPICAQQTWWSVNHLAKVLGHGP